MVFAKYSFCKPRVIHGISLNFDICLEIFLVVHKSQVKTRTFRGKFYLICQCLYLIEEKDSVNQKSPGQAKNNQEQKFYCLNFYHFFKCPLDLG